MKRLYLPVVCDKETVIDKPFGATFLLDGANAYYELEEAKESARQMSIQKPKSKVIIFEAVAVIEPTKVEFTEKVYNKSGELIT